MSGVSISLRKRIGLELARKIRENRKKQHALRQLFWSVRTVAICRASIAEATANKVLFTKICRRKISLLSLIPSLRL